MASTAELRLSGGTGILVRTEYSLLFIPSPHDLSGASTLTDLTREGPAEQLLEAVSERVVAMEFDAPAFVLITWHQTPELMVFGDIEVQTSAPSAPSVNAAGLSTWIEHRLRGLSEVTIRVEAAPVLDCSVLRSGVVPAGGFELAIARDASAPARSVSAQPLEAEPLADHSPSNAGLGSEDLRVAASDVQPELDELIPILEPEHLPASPFDDTGDHRLPEPYEVDVVNSDGDDRADLGVLVIGDRRVAVEHRLLLGRRAPTLDDRPWSEIEGDLVSKQHAEILVEEDNVYINDLGSTNGTYVASATGAEPARVEPTMKRLLFHGDTIQLGGTQILFLES